MLPKLFVLQFLLWENKNNKKRSRYIGYAPKTFVPPLIVFPTVIWQVVNVPRVEVLIQG